jgi:hypothetical protein
MLTSAKGVNKDSQQNNTSGWAWYYYSRMEVSFQLYEASTGLLQAHGTSSFVEMSIS